jgi:uncharacterized membrane protein
MVKILYNYIYIIIYILLYIYMIYACTISMHILMFPWLPLWFLRVVGTRSMLSRRKWGSRDHRDSARIAGSARHFFRPTEIKGASKRLEMKHNEPICITIYIYIHNYTYILCMFHLFLMVSYVSSWVCLFVNVSRTRELNIETLLKEPWNCSVHFTRFHGVNNQRLEPKNRTGWWYTYPPEKY